jgi:hypothetical protein
MYQNLRKELNPGKRPSKYSYPSVLEQDNYTYNSPQRINLTKFFKFINVMPRIILFSPVNAVFDFAWNTYFKGPLIKTKTKKIAAGFLITYFDSIQKSSLYTNE